MALLTDEELLEKVEAAITAILAGAQSYTIGTRSLSRGNLRTLQDMRDELLAKIAANDETGAVDIVEFGDPL